jgi:hypothetical protein
MYESGWIAMPETSFEGPPSAHGLDVTRTELDKLLYTVEFLRKTEWDDATTEADIPAAGSESEVIAP